MSPGSVAPRGLLVAALVLEPPEDVYGSRAAELHAGWAPSAALSVGLVLVPVLNTGRSLSLTLDDLWHFQLQLVYGYVSKSPFASKSVLSLLDLE